MPRAIYTEVAMPNTAPAELVGRQFTTLSPDEHRILHQYHIDHDLCWLCSQDHDRPDQYGYYHGFYYPCAGSLGRHPSYQEYASARAGEVPDHLIGSMYVNLNSSQRREVYWHRLNSRRCLACGTTDHLIDDCTPTTRTKHFRKKHGLCEWCGENHLSIDCIIHAPTSAAPPPETPLEESNSDEANSAADIEILSPAAPTSRAKAEGPLSSLPTEIQFNILKYASQQSGEIIVRSKSPPGRLNVPGVTFADSLAAYACSNAFRLWDFTAAQYMLNVFGECSVLKYVKVVHFTSYGTRVTGRDLWSTDMRETEFMLVQECSNLTEIKLTVHSHHICKLRGREEPVPGLNEKAPTDRIATIAHLHCYLDFVI